MLKLLVSLCNYHLFCYAPWNIHKVLQEATAVEVKCTKYKAPPKDRSAQNLALDTQVHTFQRCVTDICKLNGICSKFRGIMSRLYFKFGLQLPGQIAAFCSSPTMCHDKERLAAAKKDMRDTRSILRYSGKGNGATLLPRSSMRASKSKMAPCGAVDGQVRRWVPDTLWHVRSWQRSFCRRGFGLTGWQRCKWSFCAPFLVPRKPKGWKAKSCLSIQGLWGWMCSRSSGGLTDLWLTQFFDWNGWVHGNKQTRAKSTCL